MFFLFRCLRPSSLSRAGHICHRILQSRVGNRLWHTDSSFKYLPARTSLLYAKTIAPIGGHTEFADLREAYDELDDKLKQKLDGLVTNGAGLRDS